MKPSEFATEKIRELFEEYKKRGGTQVSLASACGVSQGQISLWIKRGIAPNLDNLSTLAHAFGVPLSTFLPPEKESPAAIGKIIALLPSLDEPELGRLLSYADAFAEICRSRHIQKIAKNNG